jgi:bifunctional DNA-binding transcriptional regulator/antitoxin component of YhaV-PrlF toxin-antitoxin module
VYAEKEGRMGYESKVQVIQRANLSRQFYLILPAQLAEAMELQKGERIEWVVIDRRTLEVRRLEASARRPARRGHDA